MTNARILGGASDLAHCVRPEAGHLWYDGRADYIGLSPLCSRDGSRATFSACYREWLEDAAAGIATAMRSTYA